MKKTSVICVGILLSFLVFAFLFNNANAGHFYSAGSGNLCECPQNVYRETSPYPYSPYFPKPPHYRPQKYQGGYNPFHPLVNRHTLYKPALANISVY